MHAAIKMRFVDIDGNVVIDTMWDVLFNEHVPAEAGFINDFDEEVLRGIISHVLNSGVLPRRVLDDIKARFLPSRVACPRLNDVIIPPEEELVAKATSQRAGGQLQHGSSTSVTTKSLIFGHTNQRHLDGPFGNRQASSSIMMMHSVRGSKSRFVALGSVV